MTFIWEYFFSSCRISKGDQLHPCVDVIHDRPQFCNLHIFEDSVVIRDVKNETFRARENLRKSSADRSTWICRRIRGTDVLNKVANLRGRDQRRSLTLILLDLRERHLPLLVTSGFEALPWERTRLEVKTHVPKILHGGRHRVALWMVSGFIIMLGFQDAAFTDT